MTHPNTVLVRLANGDVLEAELLQPKADNLQTAKRRLEDYEARMLNAVLDILESRWVYLEGLSDTSDCSNTKAAARASTESRSSSSGRSSSISPVAIFATVTAQE